MRRVIKQTDSTLYVYELHTFQIDLMDFDEALTLVSQQRRDHALRFRQPCDQRQSVAAYRLLQQALAVEHDVSEPPMFVYGEHGKPAIAGAPDIFFNLSHCRDAVACVVDSVPVACQCFALMQYN